MPATGSMPGRTSTANGNDQEGYARGNNIPNASLLATQYNTILKSKLHLLSFRN